MAFGVHQTVVCKGLVRHNGNEVAPVRLVARLRDKDLAERLRVLALRTMLCGFSAAVWSRECKTGSAASQCSFRRRELWARSRMTTRRLGSFSAKAARSESRRSVCPAKCDALSPSDT